MSIHMKDTYRRVKRLFLLTFVVSVTAPACLAQDASLAFVRSPNTNLHVALQPRGDHHRIHFLIRARNLRGKRCEARLICDENVKANFATPMSVDTVHFTPDAEDEVFSIYLRTPKVGSRSLTYLLIVKVAPPWDETVFTSGSAAYQWTINRDAQGNAAIDPWEPGTEVQLEMPEYTTVPEETEENGQIVTRWKIVAKSSVIEITIPADFAFNVHSSDRGIQDVVRSLN